MDIVNVKISGAPPVLIDSDGDRDTISVTTTYQYIDQGLLVDTEAFRLVYELLDEKGNAVALDSGVGVSTTAIVHSLGSHAFNEGLGASSVNIVHSASLQPFYTLSPTEDYRVRVTAQRLLVLTWVEVDDEISSYQQILHFASTDPSDASYNVLGWVDPVSFTQTHAIDTATHTGDHQHMFKAEIPFHLARYDNYDAFFPSSIDLTLRFTLSLRDSLGNHIPLDDPDPIVVTRSLREFVSSNPREPDYLDETLAVEFNPAQQLHSISRTYRLVVTMEYRTAPLRASNTVEASNSTPFAQLLHFNGTLQFGTGTTCQTELAYLSNGFTIADDQPHADSLDLLLHGISGNLSTDHSFYYMGAAASYRARLDDSGTLLYIDETAVLKMGLFADEAVDREIGGLTVTLADPDDLTGKPIKLTDEGATAYLTVRLPAGMGWREDTDFPLSHAHVAYGEARLSSSLAPGLAVLTWAPTEGECWVVEETKPVWIRTSELRWRTGTGRFELSPTGCRYVRAGELESLEDTSDWENPPSEATLRKPSNEQIYRFAAHVQAADSTATPVTTAIDTDGDGAAYLTTEFSLSNTGSLYTHFPNKARILWPAGMPTGIGGFLGIQGGEIVTGESRILDPQTVVVHYNTACSEGCEAMADDPVSQRFMALMPSGPISFTRDGGLWFEGAVVSRADNTWFSDFWTEDDTVQALYWGRRPDETGYFEFAHRTQDFSAGSFHMPGSSLAGTDSGVTFGKQPAALLYTAATDPQTDADLFRPNSLGDERGLGDYAGINLRVADQPSIDALGARQGGITCLGDGTSAGTGAEPVWYPVRDYSKYYVRSSGISGIHAAADFPDSLEVYGYAMTFDRFGLSFIDSANRKSCTKGSVVLPYPANFTQEFDELMLSCLGELENAEVPDDAGDKILDYWQTNITPLTFEFRTARPPCSVGSGKLCLGVKTGGELLSEPLFGTLAFEPDGTLITPAAAEADPAIPTDATSRLVAPNALRVRGPSNLDGGFEEYYVTPASHAYFNDWALAEGDTDPEGSGFLSVTGYMDVPFFEDIAAHIHTRGTDAATAPVYVMGGWEEDGKTFFNDMAFDPENAGYPVDAPGSLADYRAGGTNGATTYLPHARYHWLGLLPFDFPVTWHPVMRTFQSPDPIGMDIIVLSTEAEIKYLSAEQAEITFGTEFSGLPQINLAECAFSQIDEATGIASGAVQSIVKGASQEIADAIESGMDGALKLTTDRAGELLERALDQQADALVEQIYTQVNAQWDTATNNWTSAENLRTALDGQKDALANAVRNAIISGAGTRSSQRIDETIDLLTELRDELVEVQNSLRAVVGADVDTNGVVIPNPLQEPVETGIAPINVHGLLSRKIFPDGHAEYQILPGLAYALIEDLSPDLADAMSTLLSGPLDELNDRANAVLAKGETALERVRGELLRLEGEVAALRHKLDVDLPTHEFRDHIQSILDAADARDELDAYAQQVVDRLNTYLQSMGSAPESLRTVFGQMDPEEIKRHIRNVIQDSFAELDLTQNLMLGIRQRFFDLDAMIRGTVDTLFSQLNEAIKEIVAEALPDMTIDLEEFADPLGGVVKGGGLQGYARINGDALRMLRLDLDLEMNVPDPMTMRGFLEIRQEDSTGSDSGCTSPDGEPKTEVILGAFDVPVHWMDSDIELSLMTKFVFFGSDIAGFGGAIEMTDGELAFEQFVINDFGAALAFGAGEAYLAARAGMYFQDYQVAGAFFFGKTCSLDPLYLVDPDVANVLGDPPFTGAYVYGECGMPIYGTSCVFKVEALVGAGVFFFVEGPTFGGKMVAEVSGEALCAVHVNGGITLIGLKDADGFVYSGQGRVSGSVGSCPFCLKFRKTVNAINRNNSWSVSY